MKVVHFLQGFCAICLTIFVIAFFLVLCSWIGDSIIQRERRKTERVNNIEKRLEVLENKAALERGKK